MALSWPHGPQHCNKHPDASMYASLLASCRTSTLSGSFSFIKLLLLLPDKILSRRQSVQVQMRARQGGALIGWSFGLESRVDPNLRVCEAQECRKVGTVCTLIQFGALDLSRLAPLWTCMCMYVTDFAEKLYIYIHIFSHMYTYIYIVTYTYTHTHTRTHAQTCLFGLTCSPAIETGRQLPH